MLYRVEQGVGAAASEQEGFCLNSASWLGVFLCGVSMFSVSSTVQRHACLINYWSMYSYKRRWSERANLTKAGTSKQHSLLLFTNKTQTKWSVLSTLKTHNHYENFRCFWEIEITHLVVLLLCRKNPFTHLAVKWITEIFFIFRNSLENMNVNPERKGLVLVFTTCFYI